MSISTNLYGSTINKGVGGLMSGLDTDELVKQMTAGTRNKINRQYQSKQKLLYRQESYRDISTKLLAFSNKYFSYASGSSTNILSPKFFESYTFKPSSNYVNVTGNAENIKNFSIDKITSVATAASFSSSHEVSKKTIDGEIKSHASSLAGETMTLEINNKSYNITISKEFGRGTATDAAAVVEELNNRIKEALGNESVKFKAEDGIIKFETGITAKLTAASSKITEVLNFEIGKDAVSSKPIGDSKINKDTILQNTSEYITFEYNGVLKKINLDGSTVNTDIEAHLKEQLDKAFGGGKIDVNVDASGKITFEAKDKNNIFGISSISKDLSNLTGLNSGDYNRLHKTKSISELGLLKDLTLTDIGDGKSGFELDINGAKIKIDASMTVTDMMNAINNNAEAGVKIYYSSTTDTFSVKATETGLHKTISFEDSISKDFAKNLFGTSVDLQQELQNKYPNEYYKLEDGVMNLYKKSTDSMPDEKIGTIEYNKNTKEYTRKINGQDGVVIATGDYFINKGTDTVMEYTLNGVKNKITRSTANFSIDEINIELNEKASTIDFTNGKNVSFDVINNSDEVVERVKKFIEEYNEIINLIGTKVSEKPNRDYPPLVPEQQEEMKEEEIKNWNAEAKKGVLYGDSKMNDLLRSLRGSMSGLTDVSELTLSSIGISSASMDTSGKLVFDEKKFREKLIENPDQIAALFTNTSSKTGNDAKSGIALQLQNILRKNVGTYGTTGLLIDEAGMPNSMTSDKNYISEKITEYDKKMEELKKSLETERKRYWNQFTALEKSLSKLNMQSSWLTDMMGQ